MTTPEPTEEPNWWVAGTGLASLIFAAVAPGGGILVAILGLLLLWASKRTSNRKRHPITSGGGMLAAVGLVVCLVLALQDQADDNDEVVFDYGPNGEVVGVHTE